MDGNITLESKGGEGSIFKVSLCLATGEVQENKVGNQSIPADQNHLLNINHKVLIVEDDKTNQIITRMLIEKSGYYCDIAENGQEAIKAVQQSKLQGEEYSLILMDLQMPGLDGIKTVKTMIAEHGEQIPPIVALTANSFEDDKVRCFEAGMVDFVSKPIKVDELRHVLDRFLNA